MDCPTPAGRVITATDLCSCLCLRAGGRDDARGARQEGRPFPPHVRWYLCGHDFRGEEQVLMAWGLVLWWCGMFLHMRDLFIYPSPLRFIVDSLRCY